MFGLVLVLSLVACKDDKEATWTQYNATDESVEIHVGAADVEPAVSVTLHSNTGAVEIGTGSVDPGGGPIGTVHTVRVEVAEEYAADIDRASVRTNSGDRGEDEYDLTADSTGEGLWLFELESQGESGESRTDSFTFRLWTADDQGDTGG